MNCWTLAEIIKFKLLSQVFRDFLIWSLQHCTTNLITFNYSSQHGFSIPSQLVCFLILKCPALPHLLTVASALAHIYSYLNAPSPLFKATLQTTQILLSK